MGIVASIMVPHPPLIVPAVGRGEERAIAATVGAYERAAAFVMSSAPETLIVVSPHTAMYADYFHVSPGAGLRGISRSSARLGKLLRCPTTRSSCARLRMRRMMAAFRQGRSASATSGSTTALWCRFISFRARRASFRKSCVSGSRG